MATIIISAVVAVFLLALFIHLLPDPLPEKQWLLDRDIG